MLALKILFTIVYAFGLFKLVTSFEIQKSPGRVLITMIAMLLAAAGWAYAAYVTANPVFWILAALSVAAPVLLVLAVLALIGSLPR